MAKGTHLPGHLDSVRQKLRPKHQLLILKCYPRLPRNSAADAKPNGSELSYLLYYASTRRSKLQKVGTFLERKTAADLHRPGQSARVVVTLLILGALLENKVVGAGSGFALIAPYVLRIIREVLQNTSDIGLIEATLPTWAVFCRDQDAAMIQADHEYRELYESVVRKYTDLARKDGGKKLGRSMQLVAIQDNIRLRKAGLAAIESIVSSDGLASESGRQLSVVVPAILSNMRGSDEVYLSHLVQVSKENEQTEQDKAVARRMSMATVRTYTNATETSVDADPRQAEGTAQDADAFADEEAAVLALECLRTIFSTENRAQIRSGVTAVLKYLTASVVPRPQTAVSQTATAEKAPTTNFMVNTWVTKLFELCTAWTPVQERFILIVAAVEMLVRIPLREVDLPQHLMFTDLVDTILRSALNLIGLSVMDVLLSLIQHVLRALQLNGPRVAGRSSAGQIFASDENLQHPATPTTLSSAFDTPSEGRLRLTERLKSCIADLATHVYYTDQIADMLSAIFMRLRPTPLPNPAVTAAAIEDPKAAVTEVASNISLPARERSNSAATAYFSFDTARQVALEAARDMLLVANSAQSVAVGGVSDSRNKVPITVWDGTQWLLRDPAFGVRKAYIEALNTWLQMETKPSDARLSGPKDKNKKSKEGTAARRAISNASRNKDKQAKKDRNTFLQLLHLAAYEHALQYAGSIDDGEREIVMLHFLLSTLVQKLGVNALISGLPMILALQDGIDTTNGVVAKVRLGSLVHGYLWSVAEVFDFDTSSVGQEVFSEIRRRRDAGLWIRDISVPPTPLDQVVASSNTTKDIPGSISSGALQPFANRQTLVDCISNSYSTTLLSPPASTPGSPGRSPGRPLSSTGPSLERTATSYLSAKKPAPSPVLPDKVKDAMMEKWTRESCLASIAAVAPKSVSLSGSRSSPSHALAMGHHRQLLAAANTGPAPVRDNGAPKKPLEPAMANAQQPRQNNYGSRLHSQSPNGRQSASSNGIPASSAGAARNTLRVDDLKRVLAGGTYASPPRFPRSEGEDTASESLVDVEGEDIGSESGRSMGSPPPPRRKRIDVDTLLSESVFGNEAGDGVGVTSNGPSS